MGKERLPTELSYLYTYMLYCSSQHAPGPARHRGSCLGPGRRPETVLLEPQPATAHPATVQAPELIPLECLGPWGHL